jgi:hypothetical protein
LSRGAAVLLPHLARVRQLAQLLRWEAIQHSSEGKSDQAVESLLAGFALAASLRNEPLLISELVRISCVSLLLPALERVASESSLTMGQLQALRRVLYGAEMDGKTGLHRGLIGERAISLPAFRLGYAEFERLSPNGGTGLPEFLKLFLFEGRKLIGEADRDMFFFLERMESLIRISTNEFPRMLEETRQHDEESMEALRRHRFRFLISGMVLPSLENAVKKEADLAAQLRCARTAMAIEEHRKSHSGSFPPDLLALVPKYLEQIPRDPLDGSPLRLERPQNKGFRVIAEGSTAQKRKNAKPNARKPPPQDVAFTILK